MEDVKTGRLLFVGMQAMHPGGGGLAQTNEEIWRSAMHVEKLVILVSFGEPLK